MTASKTSSKWLVLALVVAAFGLILAFYQGVQAFFLEGLHLGWTTSYWIPKILLLILSLWLGKIAFGMFSKPGIVRWIAGVVVFGVAAGGAFAACPIYIEDLSDGGVAIEAEAFAGNSVVAMLAENNPAFDGVVCVASISCPYCRDAASKLAVLKERTPERDVAMVLYSLDETQLTAYPEETNAHNLDFYLTPDEQGSMQICEGRFPTFVYVREGKVIKKWDSSALGFPAYDAIEAGL